MRNVFLITYRWEHQERSGYGMCIGNDPIEWIADQQQHEETYFLINAQPIRQDQANKYAGQFKGM